MLKFDTLKNDYPSRRSVIYGRKAWSARASRWRHRRELDIIKQGGNAIDAAIATAACMTVLEPTSSGIGSDAFALVWTKGELHGLNASGRAPMAITAEKVKAGIHRDARAWLDSGDGPRCSFGLGGSSRKSLED
ncbi:MAG: gamma-glutamyltransferase [Clostridium sp.]